MEITIKFTADYVRTAEYYLRKRYGSKASLNKLAKVAICEIVALQAKQESDEVKEK